MNKNSLIKAMSLCLAIIVITLSFAGCGKKATDKDEQGRTVISIGAWPSKEGKDLDNSMKAKEEFEKANPDVVINGDVWTFDLKSFYSKAAGGQLPNYFITNFTEVPQIIDSGYSADVTEAMKKHGFLDKLNPVILNLISKDNKVYAIPYKAYVLGLTFNAELMSAAGLMGDDGTPKQPKDWYELADFAKKIKDKTGKPGFVFPSANNMGGWIFMPIAWSFGVEFMKRNKDGKWEATFNSPEAVEALEYIKDLKWKYDVLPSNTLIDNNEYFKVFATGNAGMMITAGDCPSYMVKYGMTPSQFGMMAMPAGPKRNVTLLGGSMYYASENSTKDQIDAIMRWHKRTTDFALTEQYKETSEKIVAREAELGQLVGIKSMSIWNSKAESLAYQHEMIDKYTNTNPNYVKLYNDYVAECPAEVQLEEPVCAQELYGVLDGCIQQVLVNKDADCTALIEKAAKDFQANYLDNLSY